MPCDVFERRRKTHSATARQNFVGSNMDLWKEENAHVDPWEKHVEAVAKAMSRSGAVPLPGGHGAWFPELRSFAVHKERQDDTAARCYVCLKLLGERVGEDVDYAPSRVEGGQSSNQDRWNRSAWLPHAEAWFDTYCSELVKKIDKPKWAYVLAAMEQIFRDWTSHNRRSECLIPLLEEYHKTARKRISEMTGYAARKGRLSAMLRVAAGSPVTNADERWQRVIRELEGPRPSRIEMLYFLHVLHSSLGLQQHSLDEKYREPRKPFYENLRLRLSKPCEENCALCEAGARIAKSLESTIILERLGQDSQTVGELQRDLPPCFQLANYLTRAPLRAQLSLRLASHPEARAALIVVHDLAVAIADLAMDQLCVQDSGKLPNFGFKLTDYGYFHSTIKHQKVVYDTQMRKGSLAPVETDMADSAPVHIRPMNRSFAERMIEEKLAHPSQEHLRYLVRKGGPTISRTHHCAVCTVPSAMKGMIR